MAKQFLLIAPRYLKQEGQHESRYIDASPSKPVVVELDDDYVISKHDVGLKPYGTVIEKPKPAHAGLGVVEPAKKASEASKMVDKGEQVAAARRAADK